VKTGNGARRNSHFARLALLSKKSIPLKYQNIRCSLTFAAEIKNTAFKH
jgi:hypothetical protein